MFQMKSLDYTVYYDIDGQAAGSNALISEIYPMFLSGNQIKRLQVGRKTKISPHTLVTGAIYSEIHVSKGQHGRPVLLG